MHRCEENRRIGSLYRSSGKMKLSGIYKVLLGKRQGMKVWVVDRDKVVRDLYPEFIMGGNDQRYRFNPLNEVWIDSNIGIEELEYTIAHELIERKLMRERGWSYDRAHTEGGNSVEKRMRARNDYLVRRHMATIKQLAPCVGSGGVAGRLESPVCVSKMYRAYWGTRRGIGIWIVDGPRVRKELYPDFCDWTHDLKSPFVPAKEVWLDSATSVLQVHYSVTRALIERGRLQTGTPWDEAFECGQTWELEERRRQARRIARHEALLEPVDLGVRDRGVKLP